MRFSFFARQQGTHLPQIEHLHAVCSHDMQQALATSQKIGYAVMLEASCGKNLNNCSDDVEVKLSFKQVQSPRFVATMLTLSAVLPPALRQACSRDQCRLQLAVCRLQ